MSFDQNRSVYAKTIFIPQDNLTDNFYLSWLIFTCHIIEYRAKFDKSYLSLWQVNTKFLPVADKFCLSLTCDRQGFAWTDRCQTIYLEGLRLAVGRVSNSSVSCGWPDFSPRSPDLHNVQRTVRSPRRPAKLSSRLGNSQTTGTVAGEPAADYRSVEWQDICTSGLTYKILKVFIWEQIMQQSDKSIKRLSIPMYISPWTLLCTCM